ncbi:PREDICTED: uncharacterized protein LOC105854458 isoform X5 [Condylura cristata]|nr:PREDICTED: uncharacterized protein LOC105854458 isoform X5 [Condylura cristata]
MQEIMKLKPAPKCIPPCGKVTIPTRGLQGSREVVEWHPGIPSGKVRVGLLNPERPVKALEKTKPGPGPPPGGCQCQSKVIGPWPVRETWEGSCPRLGRAAGPACAPTGLQEQIRYYSCQECTPLTCNLPLDCPVQDVTVIRGRQARFSCTVNFTLPHKDVTYIWKFAEGVRTQQQMYFRDLEHSGGSVARIRPALPSHRGTFSCSIFDDELLLARVYFYLNVTGPGSRDQTDLQITFREVLNWSSQPDRELPEPWNPSLLELLTRPDALTPDNWWLLVAIAALQSASLTLLGWVVWEWYISGT